MAATNEKIAKEGQLSTFIGLSIACENLPNLDIMSLTDGMAVLYRFSESRWIEVGRTEVVRDSLSPEFIKNFQVEYKFEERQRFKVKVFDVDNFDPQASLD
jgi:hypothetical protein